MVGHWQHTRLRFNRFRDIGHRLGVGNLSSTERFCQNFSGSALSYIVDTRTVTSSAELAIALIQRGLSPDRSPSHWQRLLKRKIRFHSHSGVRPHRLKFLRQPTNGTTT